MADLYKWTFDGHAQETEFGSSALLHGTPFKVSLNANGIRQRCAGFRLNGSSITVAANSGLNDFWAGQKSLSMWVRPSSGGAATQYLLSKENNQWYIALTSGDSTGRGFGFAHGFSTTGGGWWNTSPLFPFDKWTHLGIFYDNTDVDNNPEVWINGTSVTMTEFSTPVGTRDDDSSYNWIWGGSNSTVLNDFQIDHCMVYLLGVHEDQIVATYHESKSLPDSNRNEKELKRSWPNVEGLTAWTKKQTGDRYLHPEGIAGVKSRVSSNVSWGLGQIRH